MSRPSGAEESGRDTHLSHVNVKLGSEEGRHVRKHESVCPGKSETTEGNGPDWQGLEHGLDGHRLST